MKPTELRHKLFEVFSNNLELFLRKMNSEKDQIDSDGVNPVQSLTYVCPLCLRLFSYRFLRQYLPNPLTLEDLPPKSVGGKPQILTCKGCNNNSGRQLDKAIKEAFTLDQFGKRNPSVILGTKLSFNSSNRLSSTIRFTDEKKMTINLPTNNNLYAANILEEMKRDWNKSKINLQFRFYDPTVALIRVGYLLAFRYLGNAILFDENSAKIREQLNNCGTLMLPHSSLIELTNDKDYRDGLYFMVNPTDCKSFCIVFRIRLYNSIKRFGVFFPAAGERGWKTYCNIQNFTRPTEIELLDYTSINFLQSKELVDGYFWLTCQYFDQNS